MGNLLIDRLLHAQRNRKIVAIHTGEAMFLGYLLNINPELLVVRTITRQGLLTGVRSINMEDVQRVDFDDRYIRLIEFKEHNPEIAFGQPAAPDGIDTDYFTVTELLRKAKEARQLIFLETTLDDDFYGYVAAVGEDELQLEVYTQYAEEDGYTMLSIDKVRSVVWSDETTRAIELLLQQKQ